LCGPHRLSKFERHSPPAMEAAVTPREELAVALVILVPLVLFKFRRMGQLPDALFVLTLAVFMIFVVSRIPHSPIACINVHPPHNADPCTSDQNAWIMGLVICFPLGAGGELGIIYRRRRRP
jgi:amino acid permease